MATLDFDCPHCGGSIRFEAAVQASDRTPPPVPFRPAPVRPRWATALLPLIPIVALACAGFYRAAHPPLRTRDIPSSRALSASEKEDLIEVSDMLDAQGIALDVRERLYRELAAPDALSRSEFKHKYGFDHGVLEAIYGEGRLRGWKAAGE